MHIDTKKWNVTQPNHSSMKDDDEQPTLKETTNCPDSIKHSTIGLRLGYPIIRDNWLPSMTKHFIFEVLGNS